MFAVLSAVAGVATAQEPTEPLPRPEVDQSEPKRPVDDVDDVSVGAMGGVGFPRLLGVEAFVDFKRTVVLGAEYSATPTASIAGVEGRLWAVAGDMRLFPFKSGFFVGLRGGYQRLGLAATIGSAGIGSYSEQLDVSTVFVNPRIGFLWMWKPFALGIDAGLQIPLSAKTERSTSTDIPGIEYDAGLTRVADAVGRSYLPTIDLLKVGLAF